MLICRSVSFSVDILEDITKAFGDLVFLRGLLSREVSYGKRDHVLYKKEDESEEKATEEIF